MSLPSPPDKYDRSDQMKTRSLLERMDRENHKRGRDLEVAGSERLILASPNGARWVVTVDNTGAIAAVAL